MLPMLSTVLESTKLLEKSQFTKTTQVSKPNHMIVMESLKTTYTYILILFSLYCYLSQSNPYETFEFESPELDDFMDPSQRDIYRRWLAEAIDNHTDIHSSHATFPLSLISHQMDEIIATYEGASHYADENSTDHGTETGHRRRRLQDVNEGEWSCTNVTHVLEPYENISSQLASFVENNCTHSTHEEHEHVPDGVYIVLYCAFVLFVGCLLKYLQHELHIPIPYTVLLLIVGTILELIEIAQPTWFGHLNYGMVQVR